jgi:hypothetical protein
MDIRSALQAALLKSQMPDAAARSALSRPDASTVDSIVEKLGNSDAKAAYASAADQGVDIERGGEALVRNLASQLHTEGYKPTEHPLARSVMDILRQKPHRLQHVEHARQMAHHHAQVGVGKEKTFAHIQRRHIRKFITKLAVHHLKGGHPLLPHNALRHVRSKLKF